MDAKIQVLINEWGREHGKWIKSTTCFARNWIGEKKQEADHLIKVVEIETKNVSYKRLQQMKKNLKLTKITLMWESSNQTVKRTWRKHKILSKLSTSYWVEVIWLTTQRSLMVSHPYSQARICCNSKAECKDYTLGPNWACPETSVSN